MRYFFLAYAIIAVLLVGMMGFRGQKFSQTADPGLSRTWTIRTS